MPAHMQIKITRQPAWFTTGFDLKPLIDDVIESVASDMVSRTGGGLGAQRNTLSRQSGVLEQRIFSTTHFPRSSGGALQEEDTGRFLSLTGQFLEQHFLSRLRRQWTA